MLRSSCAARWLVLGLLTATAPGCAILAPGTGHSGGGASLDDAVAAARSDSSTHVREMDVGHEHPLPVDDVPSEPSQAAAPAPAPEAASVAAAVPPGPRPVDLDKERRRHWLAGLVGGAGSLGGADYDGYQAYGLMGGNYDAGRMRWAVTLTASDVWFRGESRLGQAFKEAYDLEIQGSGRYYLTAPHTFTGIYGLAGLGTGTLFWDYAQPVPVVQDGEQRMVEDDHINHFDFFLGAGMTLVQLRHLHLGGNLVGGVRFYGWHTYNGFDNSVLPTTGFARTYVEVEYRR